MDPTEALAMMLASLEKGDREEALEHMDNLGEWLRKQGFLPDVQKAMSLFVDGEYDG